MRKHGSVFHSSLHGTESLKSKIRGDGIKEKGKENKYFDIKKEKQQEIVCSKASVIFSFCFTNN